MPKTTVRGLAALATTAPLAAIALTASPAQAATNSNREAVSWPTTDEIVATCADGSKIGLGFDLVRNIHDYYNRAGDLVAQRRNVNYTGIFENLDTGERYTFRGTRIVTFDFQGHLHQQRQLPHGDHAWSRRRAALDRHVRRGPRRRRVLLPGGRAEARRVDSRLRCRLQPLRARRCLSAGRTVHGVLVGTASRRRRTAWCSRRAWPRRS